jgi:hypothetical protein
VQNARTQAVMRLDVLEALPSGARDLTQFASLTLGVTASTQGRNDVGGAMAESNTGLAIHGGRGDDGRVNYDGMNTNNFYGGGGGQMRTWKFNTLAVQESVIDTGGNSAESETGGANINRIPRDGGNRFSAHSILSYANADMASGKVPAALIARGSANNQKSIKQVWDYGGGVGGPIARDRLWYFSSTRFWGGQNTGANNYFNKSPVFYRYEADLDRPAYSDFWQRDAGSRFTLQASEKHKITSTIQWQRGCGCWLAIGLGAPTSPEATTDFDYGRGGGMWLSQLPGGENGTTIDVRRMNQGAQGTDRQGVCDGQKVACADRSGGGRRYRDRAENRALVGPGPDSGGYPTRSSRCWPGSQDPVGGT